MVAPTASMNPTVVTTGPEFGLDLGRSISAVGEHIIAGVAHVQQPIQLLAVVHGRIGHRIMSDQLVLGVRVHMVLGAEEAAAMLLGPARIAVLLPQLAGLLLPPRWCAPSLQLGVLLTTVPLRRHRHDTGIDDLPATRHVALDRKMLVETVKQLFDQSGLGQLLAEQPKRRRVRNAVLDREPRKRENDSRSRT